ncbi:MAG: hypothetical protein OQK35_01865 [Alphaproteobacteria bacterium]|nr:hypothetical protein [Rhodospirillales bacterium]MCW9045055.1 hypothetical protein [Alphaproteobacteria bacterium]
MADTLIIDSETDLPKGISLFDALPDDICQTLTPEQTEKLKATPAVQSWRDHPLDIRLHFPFIGDGYYLTIIGGRENRSNERRSSERHNYPLKTVANIFFFMGFGAILALITLVAMALQSAIIEF